MRLLFRIVVTAVAIWITTLLPLDVVVQGGNETWWSRVLVFLGIALILVAVNGLVRPIVRLLTLPLRILTLGLFGLVINWAMLWLAAWISTKVSFATLELGGFWLTLLAVIVISLTTVVLGGAAKPRAR